MAGFSQIGRISDLVREIMKANEKKMENVEKISNKHFRENLLKYGKNGLSVPGKPGHLQCVVVRWFSGFCPRNIQNQKHIL